jgi:ribosomal protein L11 methyltransferase
MRELVLLCPGSLAEPLSDALLEAGALSVSVEDADLDTEDEQPLFGEPGSEPNTQAWARNRLIVLLADGTDPAQLLLMAQQDLDSTAELPWHLRDVPDADWVRLTQSQFGPIQVGAHILIVPSWHADQMPAKTEAGCIAIQLDPGLAFGTGSHPTTHLCLEWLAKELPSGRRRSWIMAVVRVFWRLLRRCWAAGPVTGVDIDDQAVQATCMTTRIANRVTIQAMLPDGLAEWPI